MYLTFDPALRFKWAGYLFLQFTPSYLSTGFLYIIALGKCLDHYSKKAITCIISAKAIMSLSVDLDETYTI